MGVRRTYPTGTLADTLLEYRLEPDVSAPAPPSPTGRHRVNAGLQRTEG